jgi:hypothetical protein
MKKLFLVAAIVALCGCAGANISTQMRESGEPGSSKMLRCVDLSTGNFDNTNATLQKYDGWKLVYMSEYTTANKISAAVVMCFEKPYEN